MNESEIATGPGKQPPIVDRASLLPHGIEGTATREDLVIKGLHRLKERLTNRYAVGSMALAEADHVRIESMVATVSTGKEVTQPSLYWRKLIRLNIDQLYCAGYENFKRTLALNYFTFVNILPWDPQIRILLKRVPLIQIIRIAARALGAKSAQFYSSVNWVQTRTYHFLTRAMRERLTMMKLDPRLLALEEPAQRGPAFYHSILRRFKGLSHITVEVHVQQ